MHGLEPLDQTKSLTCLAADEEYGHDQDMIFPLEKLRDPARTSCAARNGEPRPYSPPARVFRLARTPERLHDAPSLSTAH